VSARKEHSENNLMEEAKTKIRRAEQRSEQFIMCCTVKAAYLSAKRGENGACVV